MTASAPLPDFFTQAQETVAKPLQNLLENLSARWADESEYEDIKDYAAAITKALPDDVTLDKMHKRPFGFSFTQAGHSFKLTCGSRAYSLAHLGTVQPDRAAHHSPPAPSEPATKPEPEDPEHPTEEGSKAPMDPDGLDNGDPFPGIAEIDECYVVIIHNEDWTVAELTAVVAPAARFARRLARKEWVAFGNSAEGIEFNARACGPDNA